MFLVQRQEIQFYFPAAHATTLFSLSLVPVDAPLSVKTISCISNSKAAAGVY